MRYKQSLLMVMSDCETPYAVFPYNAVDMEGDDAEGFKSVNEVLKDCKLVVVPTRGIVGLEQQILVLRYDDLTQEHSDVLDIFLEHLSDEELNALNASVLIQHRPQAL